jgi:hypothetical protein
MLTLPYQGTVFDVSSWLPVPGFHGRHRCPRERLLEAKIGIAPGTRLGLHAVDLWIDGWIRYCIVHGSGLLKNICF